DAALLRQTGQAPRVAGRVDPVGGPEHRAGIEGLPEEVRAELDPVDEAALDADAGHGVRLSPQAGHMALEAGQDVAGVAPEPAVDVAFGHRLEDGVDARPLERDRPAGLVLAVARQ